MSYCPQGLSHQLFQNYSMWGAAGVLLVMCPGSFVECPMGGKGQKDDAKGVNTVLILVLLFSMSFLMPLSMKFSSSVVVFAFYC